MHLMKLESNLAGTFKHLKEGFKVGPEPHDLACMWSAA